MTIQKLTDREFVKFQRDKNHQRRNWPRMKNLLKRSGNFADIQFPHFVTGVLAHSPETIFDIVGYNPQTLQWTLRSRTTQQEHTVTYGHCMEWLIDLEWKDNLQHYNISSYSEFLHNQQSKEGAP